MCVVYIIYIINTENGWWLCAFTQHNIIIIEYRARRVYVVDITFGRVTCHDDGWACSLGGDGCAVYVCDCD